MIHKLNDRQVFCESPPKHIIEKFNDLVKVLVEKTCNVLKSIQNSCKQLFEKMISVVIQIVFIILNLISLSLGVLSIVSLLLLPEQHYPSEWHLRNIMIYTILFVIVAKIGIIGSYFMCKLCLILYTFIMLLMISFNYLTWFVFPKQALIEVPLEFVLATSLFDFVELICALYLIFTIRTEQNNTRITPIKSIYTLE